MSKIVVLGSYVVDLMGRAPHLPKEGETIKGSAFRMGAGGKGFNQGVAAKRSGGDVTMITRIGNDSFGQLALDLMKKSDMPTDKIIISETEESGAALILVDEVTSSNEILVVSGACGAFTEADIESCRSAIETADYMLIQLEINIEAIYQAVKIAYDAGTKVILNTAPVCPFDQAMLSMVEIVTPNEVEAELITGIPVNSAENQQKVAEYFHALGVKTVVITLGSAGVFVSQDGKQAMVPAFVVKAVDTAGAGDAFNGGFVTALSQGKDVWDAAKFGCAVGALAVQRIGTAPIMPMKEEVDAFLAEHDV